MEQNTRNRRSFSNDESYDQDRYNQGGYGNNRDYNSDNDWDRNRNYGDSNRGNYGQDYGRYDRNRMGSDRNFDRWNSDYNSGSGYGNTGGNYGRSGSYSDWDFQNGSNRNQDFDTFNSNRNWDRRGQNYGQSGYNSDYDSNSGYGQGGSNYRQGNYEGRYGSQDYGRYGRSHEHGRNRDWGRDYRNENENRDWWDRTKDEVASWFGDDDARRRREMDDRREDYHRGKGPKNYTRSTERIKEDVSDRLSDAWDIDASDIEVSVDGGEVTLSGTVNSKQQKRRAEDIAESISGVTNVQNHLRVQQNQQYRSGDWSNSGGSTSMGSATTGTGAATGSSQTGSAGTGTTGSSSLSSGTATTGSTGNTSGNPSNQVKIEKSSAS